MGFLVSNGKSGKLSFSGTEYVNPTHGTKRLYLRTGTGPDDVIRYGLTSDSSASNYCGIKIILKNKTAYIGMSKPSVEVSSSSIVSSTLYGSQKTSQRTYTKRTGVSRPANTITVCSSTNSEVTSSSSRTLTGVANNATYTKSITSLFTSSYHINYKVDYISESAGYTWRASTDRTWSRTESLCTYTHSFVSSISYKESNTSGNHNFNI